MRFSSRQDVLVFQEIIGEKDIPAARFSFKKDVLLFQELVKERKVPRGNKEIECEISSQDNVYISIRDYLPPMFYRTLYL
jgi:hypothetical protein